MKDYQSLFPNKKLTPEEIEWCRRFENNSLFEPIDTYYVKNERDFIEMIETNNRWLEDHTDEVISTSKYLMRNLSYYNEVTE